jgi:hypothetical protein
VERSTASVDEYLAGLPGESGADLRALDAALAPVFAGRARVLWEGVMWGGMQRILGYGTYTYRGRSGATGEWFIVGIAAVKDHLSMHVSGAEDGVSLAQRYGPALGKVKVGSGVVSFRRLADVDLARVADLATRARDGVTDLT